MSGVAILTRYSEMMTKYWYISEQNTYNLPLIYMVVSFLVKSMHIKACKNILICI